MNRQQHKIVNKLTEMWINNRIAEHAETKGYNRTISSVKHKLVDRHNLNYELFPFKNPSNLLFLMNAKKKWGFHTQKIFLIT